MTKIYSNPYSFLRPVDPRYFSGGGDESPRTLVEHWTTAPRPRSYWIRGERRIGKTSFLMRLEFLLAQRLPPRRDRWLALPFLVSCKNQGNLRTFYESILKRASERFPSLSGERDCASSVSLTVDGFRLLRAAGNVTNAELLELFIHDLEVLLAQLPGDRHRLVFLIDNIEAAVEAGWDEVLFLQLRTLRDLVGKAAFRFGPQNLALALASGRDLAASRTFERLEPVLDQVSLSPLSWSEIRALIHGPGRSNLDNGWVGRIYRASGGHPWVVQYLLDYFMKICSGSAEDFEQSFDQACSRFPRQAQVEAVIEEIVNSLRDRESDLLAYLAIQASGISVNELVANAGASDRVVRRGLDRLRELGLVYREKDLGKGRGYFHAVAEVFRKWLLGRPLVRIFAAQLDGLSRRVPYTVQHRSDVVRPFTLMLNQQYNFYLTEGQEARIRNFPPNDHRVLSNICDRVADIGENSIRFTRVVQTLEKEFSWPDWVSAWKSYCDQMADSIPVFALCVERNLCGFPIELVKVDGNYLGLEVPIYQEITGIGTGNSYRLSKKAFASNENRRYLLVASSIGGQYGGRRYSDLPQVDVEIAEISRTVMTASSEVGKNEVLILGDQERLKAGGQMEGVEAQIKPLTRLNLSQALRGGFGAIDIVHMSGHYVSAGDESHAGLLLPSNGGLELFSLVELQQPMRRLRIDLFYFNSCQSAHHANAARAQCVGPALTCLEAGVKVFIGLRWPIEDRQAQLLGSSFYRHLTAGQAPEVALGRCRQEADDDNPGRTHWAALMMFTAGGSA